MKGQQQFMKMSAMESCFLLIDEEGHLWIWYNDASQPYKARFPWNDTETIKAVGCNMFRATVLLETNKFVTFYDKSFKGMILNSLHNKGGIKAAIILNILYYFLYMIEYVYYKKND